MSEPRKQVTLPFAPRPWQRKLMEDPAPRIVAVVHRRAGKSTALMWMGLKRALTEKKPNPRVVHILPYGVMWKRTGLWDQLAQAADAIPGAVVMRSELSVKLANGGVFQAGGADNIDSWRGGGADLVIVDEYDDTPPSLIPLVIEPMIADRNGTLVRSGTPKGNGLLQSAYDRARTAPGHSSYLLDYTKTRVLSDDAIERLRAEMSDEEFQQELCVSFNAPNSGTYYGRLMQEAEEAGRITAVDYDRSLPVWTSWDLGIDDATAIWFCQITVGGEFRFIDYIEDSGAALDHYVDLLQGRPYKYEMHLLPHDAAVKELGSGRSRTETLASMGLFPYRVLRAHSIADGINAVRIVLPRAWFDAEKCAQGIKALRNYRREWNAAGETWRVNPRHDWSSHCFAGDTKVLTRYGTYQIKNLPQSGEVLTPCGWRPYHSPRITRRNAQLVEVAFNDGNTVRCTPDHMFLTASGWMSASDLQMTSPIQSCLTLSRSISLVSSIVFGQVSAILRSAGSARIAWFGRWLSARSRMVATFITGIMMSGTTPYPTLSAFPQASTSPLRFLLHTHQSVNSAERRMGLGSNISRRPHASEPQNGTVLKRGDYGIVGMPWRQRDGSKRHGFYAIARSVARSLWPSTGRMFIRTSIAPRFAKRALGASVTPSSETADVWCITVPNIECFALGNGAVVHNCADSMRYMCIATRETLAPAAEERVRDSWEKAWSRANKQEVADWRVA